MGETALINVKSVVFIVSFILKGLIGSSVSEVCIAF